MKSLIIDGRIYGFFSNILQVVDNLRYCDMNQYKPIIRLNGFIYTDGRENIWDYYYERINDCIPEGKVEVTNFFKLNGYILDFPGYKSVLWNMPNNIKEHRKDVNEIYTKYIKLSKYLQSRIDGFNIGENALGVHIRGTDYGFNIDPYISKISEILSMYDKVFVASDNFESIDKLRVIFGDRIIFYDVKFRTKNYKDPVLCYNVDDKLLHGEEVLIESHLLSMCKHLLCINSNVSLNALYINPNLTFELLHRSDSGG